MRRLHVSFLSSFPSNRHLMSSSSSSSSSSSLHPDAITALASWSVETDMHRSRMASTPIADTQLPPGAALSHDLELCQSAPSDFSNPKEQLRPQIDRGNAIFSGCKKLHDQICQRILTPHHHAVRFQLRSLPCRTSRAYRKRLHPVRHINLLSRPVHFSLHISLFPSLCNNCHHERSPI